MKRIRIINGTYGHRSTGGVVEPKQAGDQPFEVSDVEASRLVDLKIAVIIDSAANENTVGSGLPAYDETMKLEQLKEIARIYGLDDEALTGLKSKKAVVAAIDAKVAADETPAGADGEDPNDDDELPPDLTPSDLV
jgi:hypothetical protein